MRTDDPAHDWDVYCAEQEERWKAYIRGKTCRDCGHCTVNPTDDSEWGWCDDCDGFVALDDSVEDLECEAFG